MENESFIKSKKMILQIIWINPDSLKGLEESIVLEGVYDDSTSIFLANLTKEEAENLTGKTKKELIGKTCILELHSKITRISKINKKTLSFFSPLINRN